MTKGNNNFCTGNSLCTNWSYPSSSSTTLTLEATGHSGNCDREVLLDKKSRIPNIDFVITSMEEDTSKTLREIYQQLSKKPCSILPSQDGQFNFGLQILTFLSVFSTDHIFLVKMVNHTWDFFIPFLIFHHHSPSITTHL